MPRMLLAAVRRRPCPRLHRGVLECGDTRLPRRLARLDRGRRRRRVGRRVMLERPGHGVQPHARPGPGTSYVSSIWRHQGTTDAAVPMTWLAERFGSTATGTVGETIRVPGPRRWDTESYAAIARWLGRTPSSEGPSLNTRSMDSFEGRELFDSNGYKIGDIESVFTDDGLEFALVKSGLF